MTWLDVERVALALSVPLLLSAHVWPMGLLLTILGSVTTSDPMWALAGALGVWRLLLGTALHPSPLEPPRFALAFLWMIWVVMMSVAPEILGVFLSFFTP